MLVDQIGVGDKAPEFTLPGIPGPTYSLSSYLGSIVVLAFYPADNSPVCTTQMRSYSMEKETFEGVDATILGISPQKVESHAAFSSKNNIGIPLLSDQDKAIGRAYGVLGPLGFYRRSIFIINQRGFVAYAQRKIAGLSFSSTSTLLREIAHVS